MKGRHISKRSSRKLSRCTGVIAIPVRPQVYERYPNELIVGLTPREYRLFCETRVELEKIAKRKVTSQEIRATLTLLKMIAVFKATAQIVRRRKEIEEVRSLLRSISLVTSLAVQQ